MPYQIEVDRIFSAAHQLRLPDGSMEPVHGHNWLVTVVVGSDVLDAMDCVMDFHELERQLDAILRPWNGRHLNEVEPFVSGVNPSAERVAEVIAGGLVIASPARLTSVTVTEAAGCRARFTVE